MTDLYLTPPPTPPASQPEPEPVPRWPGELRHRWQARRALRRVPGHEYLLTGGLVQLDNVGKFQVHGRTTRIDQLGVKVCYTDPVGNFVHAQFVAWTDLIGVTPIRPAPPVHEPTVLDYAADTNTTVEELLTVARQIRDTMHRIEQHIMTTAPAGQPSPVLAWGAGRIGDSPIGATCQTCRTPIHRWHVDPEPVNGDAGWWVHKPGTCPIEFGPHLDAITDVCARCNDHLQPGMLVVPVAPHRYIHDEPCVPMAMDGVR
jgi:hypothetical protein